MNVSKINVPVFLIVLSIAGCQKGTASGPVSFAHERTKSHQVQDHQVQGTGDESIQSLGEGLYEYKSMQYKAQFMTALEFVQRRGERVQPEDVKLLEKEDVLIMEFLDNASNGEFENSEHLQLRGDKLMSYLMAGILDDVRVFQGTDTLHPHSTQIDRDIGRISGSARLRVFLFFNNIDSSKEFEASYFDRLYGAGEIQL